MPLKARTHDKETDLTQAMDRLYEAIDALEPGTPEWDALFPEYDAAYQAWNEYHETECPICRRIDQRLRQRFS